MAWLELKIDTLPAGIEAAAAALTAAGFEDLVLEDQAEFETFLEGNKAYWDYIDEDLQRKLQGLSCIKLYLEEVTLLQVWSVGVVLAFGNIYEMATIFEKIIL